MNRQTRIIVWVAASALVLAFLVITIDVRRRLHELANHIGCQGNLTCFDIALTAHCKAGASHYPARLSQLPGESISAHFFLCPGDVKGRDDVVSCVSNADLTASYIYVANLSTNMAPDMPVILCPPMHHGNRAGIVLLGNHSRSWMGKVEFDKLIDKLYADTNLTIVVSESLTKRSKGRYKSHP